MQVAAAYLGVILIWTTTPLAIQWSGQGGGFLFGVTGRMAISVIVALVLVMLLRLPMAWHRNARRTYLASGMGIYGAMLAVYWSSQFIPSGWIAVVFGLTPVVTGLMSIKLLDEQPLTFMKGVGMLLGLLGLFAIFFSGEQISENAALGVTGVLVAVLLHSYSMVLVKRAGYNGHGLVITAGGLTVAVPLYLLTWFLTGSAWPEQLPSRTIASIVYLGLIGSVLGFALFYFVLKHVSAMRVALLTLITPVTALWLGHALNNEDITLTVVAGTLLIIAGLALFELGERKAVSVQIE